MAPVYTTRTNKAAWKSLVVERLRLMCATYGVRNKVSAGIDLRMSGEFVQKDILRAHELLDVYDANNELTSFAFLKKYRALLYIALIVSLTPGGGQSILYELQHTPRFVHSCMVVRSTDRALPFYLKCNFRLFDWAGVESGYVGDGDERLTSNLRNGAIDATRDELRRRSWLHDDELEWPLLTFRDVPQSSTRSSARLRSRREAKLLLPSVLRDRTSSATET